jgi:hypothetical protein
MDFSSLVILKVAPELSWKRILTGRRSPVAMEMIWLVEAWMRPLGDV